MKKAVIALMVVLFSGSAFAVPACQNKSGISLTSSSVIGSSSSGSGTSDGSK